MTPKTVREIMTTEVVTLLRSDTLRLADDMMILTNLRHFPVLEEGKAVGIIHRLDLIRASLVSVIKYRNLSPGEILSTVVVNDVQMEPPTTISPDATLKEAARIVVEKNTDCLLVVERGDVVGLATRTDLLRAMARD